MLQEAQFLSYFTKELQCFILFLENELRSCVPVLMDDSCIQHISETHKVLSGQHYPSSDLKTPVDLSVPSDLTTLDNLPTPSDLADCDRKTRENIALYELRCQVLGWPQMPFNL